LHRFFVIGIFDDPAMVAQIKEAVATIKKAALQANELYATLANANSAQTLNQIVRWIHTKEEHADKIINMVSQYCLCQRVKPEVFASEHDYTDALKAHHAVMVRRSPIVGCVVLAFSIHGYISDYYSF
jgi:small subunit ribosomal protein S27Ae